jgi:hypothetical protein
MMEPNQIPHVRDNNQDGDALLSETNHKAIQDAIERVFVQARGVPGLILTEDDLKCHLFLELSKWRPFSSPIETQEAHIGAFLFGVGPTLLGSSAAAEGKMYGRPTSLDISETRKLFSTRL